MGSVYKRGKYYYLDVRIDGKRIRKKVGTSKRVADLALKDYVKSQVLTLSEMRKEY